jgi:hypothetical protein
MRSPNVPVLGRLVELSLNPFVGDDVEDVIPGLDLLGELFAEAAVLDQGHPRPLVGQGERRGLADLPLFLIFGLD